MVRYPIVAEGTKPRDRNISAIQIVKADRPTFWFLPFIPAFRDLGFGMLFKSMNGVSASLEDGLGGAFAAPLF